MDSQPAESSKQLSQSFTTTNPQIPGSHLIVDEQTGYLVPGMGYKLLGFSATKKLRFIELLRTHPQNIGKVCKAVGIDRATFTNHYKIDSLFREHVDDIREDHLDDIEETFMTKGKQGDFMPGVATLRAYRKEKWDPDHIVTIRHEVSESEAVERASRLSNVLDAELVERPQIPNTPQPHE